MLAIVSKAVFERDVKSPTVGTRYNTDRYVSTSKALSPLASGGSLFLVTVRPGDCLWLVAILETPQFKETAWVASPNTVDIVDISALVPQLRFSTGKGIQCAPGKLGMSLQTPRQLTGPDVTLLRATAHSPAQTSAGSAGGSKQREMSNATPQLPLIFQYAFDLKVLPWDSETPFIFRIALGGGKNHDLLAVATTQGIFLFDTTKRAIHDTISLLDEEHDMGYRSGEFILDWSPDGRYLVFTDGCRVRLYDLIEKSSDFIKSPRTQEPLSLDLDEGTPMTFGLKCVAWSPDSLQFAIGNRIYDNHLNPIKLGEDDEGEGDDEEEENEFNEENINQNPVIWYPEKNAIIIGEDPQNKGHHELELWDLVKNSRKSLGFTGGIFWLEWNPVQKGVLLIGTNDGKLTYFDVIKRKILRSVTFRGWVMGIVPIPETECVFIIGEGKIILYDGKRDSKSTQWVDHLSEYFSICVAVEASGKFAIIFDEKKFIKYYDLQPLRELK